MFFKKTSILSLLLLLTFIVFGQRQKLFWSPPSLADLEMRQFPDDTTVSAMVLEKYADVYFDDWREELRLIYSVRKRIKIFKPDGLKYARLEIPYIGYDYFEDFSEIKGFIYHLSNNKIVRKRLKKKYIHKKQITPYIYVLQMEFPQAQPGDIVEIRYTLATFKFLQPPRWYFQEDIPVRYSEFNANIPFFIKYYFSIYGGDILDEKKIEDAYASIEWSARYTDPIPSGMYYRGYDFRANPNLNFHSTYYHFVMKDIPPFYPEDFVDNPKEYYYHLDMNLYRVEREIGYSSPRIRFLWELFSKRLFQTTQIGYTPMTKERSQNSIYPPGFIIFDASNWNSLAKNLRKDPAFGIFLKKSADIIPIANQIKQKTQKQDSLQLVINSYNWVKDNIKWNGSYTYLASDHMRNILKKHKGTSADINLTLVALLRYMGFDANPVIIRTLDRGHLLIDLAAFYQFNHLLASVKIHGKTILLDAIKPQKPWFVLDKNDMNQSGFLIAQDTSYFVNLFHPVKAKQEFILYLKQQENGAKGEILHTLQGVFRLDSTKYNLSQQIANAYLQQNIFVQSNQTTFTEKYTIEIPDIITEDDSTLALYPFRIFNGIHNIFPIYSRSLPIYFGHRWTQHYRVELTLNQPVKKDKLPRMDKSINGTDYHLNTTIDKNKLILDLSFNLNRYYFDVSEFSELYDFWDNFASLRNAKIILYKK